MKKKRWIIFLGLTAVVITTVLIGLKILPTEKPDEVTRGVRPVYGEISIFVSTTGVVEPQNRLELKPAISGRIEEILVREGDMVRAGQVLARMSSTERATLLDAARARGSEAVRYWEEVYKATPIMAPIDGEVIAREVEPGQTVGTDTPILVLSDRLIVKAQVDETDIGKVKRGQTAFVSLDAYPETRVKAEVDHIAYESEIVNNVTIYEVDILPDKVPAVFRSGMSANVEIVEKSRENVLLLPVDAIRNEDGENFVLVQQSEGRHPEPRKVDIGLSDGEQVEIVSGIGPEDLVFLTSQVYSSSKNNRKGGSPLTPWGRRRK